MKRFVYGAIFAGCVCLAVPGNVFSKSESESESEIIQKPGTGSVKTQNAKVLPKGVSFISVDANFFLPIDTEFNDDGDTQSVATNLNGPLGTNMGLPPGGLFGYSVVDFEYDIQRIYVSYGYGLTDKFTAAIVLPYWWVKNEVSADINHTGANFGKSPTGAAQGTPFVPLGTFGDEVLLSAKDIQNLLGSVYGFKPVETWRKNGIGDIQIGGRYQYYSTDKWALSFTGGVQFPSGYSHDVDSLVDYGWSDDAVALMFNSNNDYMIHDKLLLNATLRYSLTLPDQKEVRLLRDPNEPIALFKEDLDRNLGDVFEFETSGLYKITDSLGFTLLYRFGYKSEDSVDGDFGHLGYDYKALEDETDYMEHLYIVNLTYTTFKQFEEKKFPVPLRATISYRNRFAGRNLFQSDYIGLNVAVYF